MRTITRLTLVRYFFPFDVEGRLDILGWWYHRHAYLRRNVLMYLALMALQQLLTGMGLTGTGLPHTLWQTFYLCLYFPFGTVAMATALMILDNKGPKS